MSKPVSFKNAHHLTLRGFIHEPSSYTTAVIFLHGFPASNYYPVSTRIGRSLEQLGYLVLRFEFSGTNLSDGEFADKLMSREAEDIQYAIDFMKANYQFSKLVVIGHSTGAIDAALYAFSDERIDKLILLGGVGRLDEAVAYDFTEEQVNEFLSRGYTTFDWKDHWTFGKRLNRTFYDEFFNLDVLGNLGKFKHPVLIIHGSDDEVVPATKDPIELKNAARDASLVIIPGADHQFLEPAHWAEVITEIDQFIRF